MDSPYVFISYSTTEEDKSIVTAICHFLEKHKIQYWIASRDIVPGSSWPSSILKAIQKCDILLLIYSKNSSISPYVQNEVSSAFGLAKKIIPFMIDATPLNDEFEFCISRIQQLRAYPNYKIQLKSLKEIILKHFHSHSQNELHIADKPMLRKTSVNKDIEEAKIAIQRFDLEAAFSLLINPALENNNEAQFLIRTLLVPCERIVKIKRHHFLYVKEQADEGNAFAQYVMTEYYKDLDDNPKKQYYYADLCASQNMSYGVLAMYKCYEFGRCVKQDSTIANKYLDRAFNMKDPFAVLFRAKALLYGWYGEPNYHLGLFLLQQCMQQGIPESFMILGDLYREGDGVKVDVKRAEKAYKQAIEYGHFEAYNNWAAFYLKADSDKDDVDKGLQLLHKGIRHNEVNCLSSIAICYEFGVGVPVQKEQALRFYKKAAKAGDRCAHYHVSRMLYDGEGCSKDSSEAWKWASKGAQLGESTSYYFLGMMCLDGQAAKGKQKIDCISYFEQSMFIGGNAAEWSALKLYEIFRTEQLHKNTVLESLSTSYVHYDWVTENDKKALRYLKEAAERRLGPDVLFMYGVLLCTEGNGLTDDIEGVKYLELALEKGNGKAVSVLAEMYEKNDFLMQDIDTSQDYYQIIIDWKENNNEMFNKL